MTKKLLNPAKAGHVLGVCWDRIIEWDRDGSLVPTRRLGPQGRRQYDLATLAAFHPVEPEVDPPVAKLLEVRDLLRGKGSGAWSIPKGEVGPGEEPLDAAVREFAEETGTAPTGPNSPWPRSSRRGQDGPRLGVRGGLRPGGDPVQHLHDGVAAPVPDTNGTKRKVNRTGEMT